MAIEQRNAFVILESRCDEFTPPGAGSFPAGLRYISLVCEPTHNMTSTESQRCSATDPKQIWDLLSINVDTDDIEEIHNGRKAYKVSDKTIVDLDAEFHRIPVPS